jgi:hypothetical protein
MGKLGKLAEELLEATALQGFTVSDDGSGSVIFIRHEDRLAAAKIDGTYKRELVVSVMGCDGEQRIGCFGRKQPLDAIRVAVRALTDVILVEGASAIENGYQPDDDLDMDKDPYDTAVFRSARILPVRTGT